MKKRKEINLVTPLENVGGGGGYEGTILKIEEFNGREQIFQVTWPRTWEEQTFHVSSLGLGQNIFFQVTRPRTWEEQTFHVPGL